MKFALLVFASVLWTHVAHAEIVVSALPTTYVRANIIFGRSWTDHSTGVSRMDNSCRGSVQVPVYVSADGSIDNSAVPISFVCEFVDDSGVHVKAEMRLANYIDSQGTPYANTETVLLNGEEKAETANFSKSGNSNLFLKDINAVGKMTVYTNTHYTP